MEVADRFDAVDVLKLKAGVWNAQVRLREVRQRGYGGGYTILKDCLHPQRTAPIPRRCAASRRRHNKQAQVDWGHLGDLETDGAAHRIWGFTITPAYARQCIPAPPRGGWEFSTGEMGSFQPALTP